MHHDQGLLILDPPMSAGAGIGGSRFNKQQQTLIQDLLEDLDSPAVREALSKDEDALIVKNLENMQGDERDVIIVE